MMGKSHLIAGEAFYFTSLAVAAQATDSKTTATAIVGGGVIAAYASLLPDIDGAQSTITKGGFIPGTRSNPILMILDKLILIPIIIFGKILRKFAAHRGPTHSWVFTAILSLTCLLLTVMFNGPMWIPLAFFMGYISHLTMDATTVSGIRFMWPINDEHYRFPLWITYIRTNTPREKMIRWFILFPCMVIAIAICVYLMGADDAIQQIKTTSRP